MGDAVISLQNLIKHNPCFDCGKKNAQDLGIDSYRAAPESDTDVRQFLCAPHHLSGRKKLVNGGIIATVNDCHSVYTAMADGYRREGRSIGSAPTLWNSTENLNLNYLRPAAYGYRLELRAKVIDVCGKKNTVVLSQQNTVARAQVTAIRVDDQWIN